ncbi:DMT family transporter (plasmid) [Rhodobacter capsulatus]|uniref:DMT family transporter n=1 Tax=Rhodobacter capsulatus TaxID=1061 RepID=UPI004028B8E7
MGSLTTPRPRLSGEPLGIALRIGSTLAFAAMTACIKALGDAVPLGQVVFFRSAVALLPLVLFLWWTGDFPRGLATRRPFGHIARCLMGAAAMFTSFATLRYLPLAEATLLSYLAPVVLALLGWGCWAKGLVQGGWAASGWGWRGRRPSACPPSRAGFRRARLWGGRWALPPRC